MDPHDLLELNTSLGHIVSGNDDPVSFQQALQEGEKWIGEFSSTPYLFSTEVDGIPYDVFEVPGGSNSFQMDRLRAEKDFFLGVAPADHDKVRHLMALPFAGEDSATRYLLGLPRWERALFLASLLVEGDQYMPLAATHKGLPPESNRHVQAVIDKVLEVASTPEFRQPIERPSPELPDRVLRAIDRLTEEPIDGWDRDDFVSAVMALEDLSFLEAVSRILVRAEPDNSWVISEPRICRRAREVAVELGYEDTLKQAPWKDAGVYPYDHRPVLRIVAPSLPGQARSSRSPVPISM